MPKTTNQDLPRILLTGFDPFGGESINPSWEAVRTFDGRRMGGHRIVARQLPTEFAGSLRALKTAVRELAPTVLAGGRTRLSIERVAINVQDARIADNAGAQPVDEPVAADGPAAYFSTLPIKAMLAALHAKGLPAEISQTAGTYVCNHIAYAMLHLASKKRGVRAGFIHIPYLPEQAAHRRGAASMAQSDVIRGLDIALRSAIATSVDRKLSAGALN
jgi:pyroglutamyl-peptidase